MEKAKKPFFQYSTEQMDAAIAACRNGMPFSTSAKTYGVPRNTLKNKVTGKTPVGRKMGPPSILTKKEENAIVDWIIAISNKGFSPHKDDLLLTVQKIMKNSNRINPFLDDKPGRKWLASFFKRNPRVSVRVPETLTSTRANVTEEKLRSWFQEVFQFLETEEYSSILNHPERIYNCDESAFQICPKSKKVIGPRGERNIYEIAKGAEKESITVALTISANGTVLPPFLLYSYSRLPGSLVSNVPKDWGLGKNEKGWMTGESFYEYVANVFHPWLLKNNIPLPVIMFIDGHKSHLTLHLSEFCEQNKIVLIALYPNSTHIIQPCDVSVFKPLKDQWRKTVHNWRLDSNIEVLNKNNFPLMFAEAMKAVTKECIVNGFQRCGLYPWNPSAVDYTKCIKDRHATSSEPRLESNLPIKCTRSKCLVNLEKYISPEAIDMFKECGEKSWSGEEKWTELFNVWKAMKGGISSKPNKNHNEEVPLENTNSTQIECQEDNIHPEESILIDVHDQNCDQHKTTSNIAVNTEVNAGEINNSFAPESADFDLSIASDVLNNTGTPSISLLDQSILTPENKINFHDISPTGQHESSNSSIGSPFKQALIWPEHKQNMLKRKRNVERTPSVVTSREWQKFMKQKEEKKKSIEKAKEERKRLRENKKLKKQQELEEKKKRQKKKQQTTQISDSEESENDSVQYADSTSSDPEDFSDLIEKENDENVIPVTLTKGVIPNDIGLYTEHNYAVYYDEQYFIGRIIKINEEEKLAKIKFLKEVTENSFRWPMKDDIDEVGFYRIFYGPIMLFGNDPFSLENGIIKKVKVAYRHFKINQKNQ